MQFRDLGAQYTALKEDIDSAIAKVITDCNFISGRQVDELETELAEYVGVKHCITCGNGTDALMLMLMAWNIKKGDAVFVPDFTFFSSGEVVSFLGATPVFYDVCEDTFNGDANSLEKAIRAVLNEGKLIPKAIISVDLFGLPADYDKLEKMADKYNLLLLEDGAQGFGGQAGKRKACSFGNAATTSFFPAKPLGCYGDGGAIFVNDDEVAEYLRSVRIHGKGVFKYDNVRIGVNSRLDTIQAAILQVKFKAFKEYELDKVNEAATYYEQFLRDIVKTPTVPKGYISSWAQYTIQLNENRDAIQKKLREMGIPTMVYYPKAMHRQKAFDGNVQYVECNTTEKLCKSVLALPIHPYLQKKDVQVIAEAVKECI